MTDPDWQFDYIDIGSVSLSEGITCTERVSFSASPSRARRPVREGDILVSTVRTYLKAIAAVGPSCTPQVASTGFAVLRANRNIDRRFLYRVVQSPPFVAEVVSRSAGVSYPAISPSSLSSIKIPVPDINTQSRIADFLDRETALINLLIERKQRLVRLLAEKLETEIIRLMTRGVEAERNQFVKSVYDWAPDVPANWTQTPLRQLLRLTSKSVGERSSEFLLLSLTKQGVIPRDVESGKGKFPADFSSYQVVQPNQLVLCLFDIDETPRTVGLSNMHGMVTGAYTVAEIDTTRVAQDFIYFHLLYLDNRKRLRPFYTGLRKVIRPQTFLNIRLPVPPMEEQAQIVRELRAYESQANRIANKTNTSIDSLKEYRSALITAAITGQIDVDTYTRSGVTDRRLDEIQKEMGA